MHALAGLSEEPIYKSNKDAIHHAFGLVRHYIGRLGHHFRAANVLLSCASRLSDLLYDFEVRSITTPPKSELPPADGMTRLESIVIRMLPNKSPHLDRYQSALTEMDSKYQLSHRFLENYTDHNLKPRVHAEIQILERFFSSKMSFAGHDPFIACSKPACFCCLLYFRYHPGHFVEPMSHRKVYLNWRPPDLDIEDDTASQNRQRDILNLMTHDIRKEALQQIDGKIAPHPWHPDSLTGITESVLNEQGQGLFIDANESLLPVGYPIGSNKPLARSEESSKITRFDSIPPALPNVDAVGFNTTPGYCEQDDKSSQIPQPTSYEFEDDSEEGGVLL